MCKLYFFLRCVLTALNSFVHGAITGDRCKEKRDALLARSMLSSYVHHKPVLCQNRLTQNHANNATR